MYKVIKSENGKLTKDDTEILDEQVNFYENLYTANKNVKFNIRNTYGVRLDDNEKLLLDCEPTVEELHKGLLSLKKEKNPGCNGLTCEFYVKFWQVIKTPLMNMLLQAKCEGLLSLSAR